MTILKTAVQKNEGLRERSRRRATTALCTVVLFLSVWLSPVIADAVRLGLRLSVGSVIPAVFPFMVLSAYMGAYARYEDFSLLGRAFERTFRINRVGVGPFLCGLLCGFPIGVKMSVELYREGRLTKNEAERLIGFCNNTGPSFLLIGIGLSMRSDATDGMILYLCMAFSAVAVGALFARGAQIGAYLPRRKTAAFDPIGAIRDAGIGTLTVTSFLTFFAVIVGILRRFLKSEYALGLLLPLLEVGNAAHLLAKTDRFSPAMSLALTGFAVCFSGVSVHWQAMSFLSDTDLDTRTYYAMKLLQGGIGAAATYLCAIARGRLFDFS